MRWEEGKHVKLKTDGCTVVRMVEEWSFQQVLEQVKQQTDGDELEGTDGVGGTEIDADSNGSISGRLWLTMDV
jgi:hypothetical protein